MARNPASETASSRGSELKWLERNLWWLAFLGVGLVFAIYLGTLIAVLWPIETLSVGASGTFGDSFGVLTALFSALAFAGVVVSLYYQRRDLGLAQEEFRDTRAQMERSQRENNFFQLFKAQMEIVAQVRTMGRLTYDPGEHNGQNASDESRPGRSHVGWTALPMPDYRNIPVESQQGYDRLYWKRHETDQAREGRGSFRRMHAELSEIFDHADVCLPSIGFGSEDQIVGRLTCAYAAFSEQRLQNVAHYFQSLYWLLRFLSDEPFDDADRRTKGRLVRAQLSPYELGLIYVYCAQLETTALEPSPAAFRALASEFELFQALPIELVIAPELLSKFDDRAFGTNLELLRRKSQDRATDRDSGTDPEVSPKI